MPYYKLLLQSAILWYTTKISVFTIHYNTQKSATSGHKRAWLWYTKYRESSRRHEQDACRTKAKVYDYPEPGRWYDKGNEGCSLAENVNAEFPILTKERDIS